jgi:HK97 family phage portal protein
MSLWDTIRGVFYPSYPSVPPPDERALTYEKIFGTGADLGMWTSVSAAGENVTAETIMRAAAGACVRLLADDIAAMPIDVFLKVDGDAEPVQPPRWVRSPTGRRFDTSDLFVSDLVTSLGTDGNAFVLAKPNVIDVERVEVLDPAVTTVEEVDGVIVYRNSAVQGGTLTDANIVHIPWVRLPGQLRGIAPVEASRESSGLELAAQKWAGAFFKNAGTLGGIVEVPGGPETVDSAKLRAQFESRHTGSDNWWKPGVLTGGATYKSTTPTPKDADLEPLFRHCVEEAARLFHIPPHLLGSQSAGAVSYASVEQRSIEYVVHGVVPFTTRLERVLSRLLPGQQYLKFNVNGLLRGDVKSRWEAYGIALDKKVMQREEVRSKEDMPNLGELGFLETPNNNGPREAQPAARGMGVSIDATVDDDQLVAFGDAQREAIEEMRALAASVQHDRDQALTDRVAARRELADLRDAVEAHVAPSAPVIDIRRDERGKPIEVYERRGDSVTRKTITYDAEGRMIGIRAA